MLNVRAKQLKYLILSDGIGGYAFSECKNITTIYIPESVESIGNNAFEACTNLKEIQINKKRGSIQGEPWSCPIGARGVKWLQD